METGLSDWRSGGALWSTSHPQNTWLVSECWLRMHVHCRLWLKHYVEDNFTEAYTNWDALVQCSSVGRAVSLECWKSWVYFCLKNYYLGIWFLLFSSVCIYSYHIYMHTCRVRMLVTCIRMLIDIYMYVSSFLSCVHLSHVCTSSSLMCPTLQFSQVGHSCY